jgi:hypothetical protein|tara:strand:- start:287 stop:469 length:183 start_codon:yes stop_codon:yes gene_type:complete
MPELAFFLLVAPADQLVLPITALCLGGEEVRVRLPEGGPNRTTPRAGKDKARQTGQEKED